STNPLADWRLSANGLAAGLAARAALNPAMNWPRVAASGTATNQSVLPPNFSASIATSPPSTDLVPDDFSTRPSGSSGMSAKTATFLFGTNSADAPFPGGSLV